MYFLLKQMKNCEEVSALKNNTITSMTSTIKLFILEGNAGVKLLEKESSSGVLSISPEMMEELKLKHPPASEIEEDSLLRQIFLTKLMKE